MSGQISVLRLFIGCSIIIFPLLLIVLFFKSEKAHHQILFLLFMLFHAFERIWETFYTTKERHRLELHGDWTLGAVTGAQLALCLFVALEFFTRRIAPRMEIVILGLVLYGLAFRIRWWGMRSLGKQWAIHAVGVRKVRRVRLLRLGAYKYMRHPIYLAVILEVLSIPVIANTFYSFLFSCLVNVPLQYIRAVLEEKSSLRRFGSKYEKYRKEVGMFLPAKRFIGKTSI